MPKTKVLAELMFFKPLSLVCRWRLLPWSSHDLPFVCVLLSFCKDAGQVGLGFEVHLTSLYCHYLFLFQACLPRHILHMAVTYEQMGSTYNNDILTIVHVRELRPKWVK